MEIEARLDKLGLELPPAVKVPAGVSSHQRLLRPHSPSLWPAARGARAFCGRDGGAAL